MEADVTASCFTDVHTLLLPTRNEYRFRGCALFDYGYRMMPLCSDGPPCPKFDAQTKQRRDAAIFLLFYPITRCILPVYRIGIGHNHDNRVSEGWSSSPRHYGWETRELWLMGFIRSAACLILFSLFVAVNVTTIATRSCWLPTSFMGRHYLSSWFLMSILMDYG